MREELGRSLIELVGVLAIGAIMVASSVGMYSMIRANQTRAMTNAQLEQLVRDTRMLMGARGDYTGVSVDYLIKAGALKSDKSPIGGDWSVTVGPDPQTFIINLTELTVGECDYFVSAPPKWAHAVYVNGMLVDSGADNCFSTRTNQISFIIE